MYSIIDELAFLNERGGCRVLMYPSEILSSIRCERACVFECVVVKESMTDNMMAQVAYVGCVVELKCILDLPEYDNILFL